MEPNAATKRIKGRSLTLITPASREGFCRGFKILTTQSVLQSVLHGKIPSKHLGRNWFELLRLTSDCLRLRLCQGKPPSNITLSRKIYISLRLTPQYHLEPHTTNIYSAPVKKNITTGKTSQAITPFHFFDKLNFHHWITFIPRLLSSLAKFHH